MLVTANLDDPGFMTSLLPLLIEYGPTVASFMWKSWNNLTGKEIKLKEDSLLKTE